MLKREEIFDRYRNLQTFVNDNLSKPFSWGEHDCSIFALAALETQLGKSIDNPFLGKYNNHLGAFKLLKEHGGIRKILEKELPKYGLEKRENKKHFKRGDLVLFRQEGELVCGIIDLTGFGILIPSDDGLMAIYYKNVHLEEVWGID